MNTISITCKTEGVWPVYVVKHGSYFYLPITLDDAFDYAVNVLGAIEPVTFDDNACKVSK